MRWDPQAEHQTSNVSSWFAEEPSLHKGTVDSWKPESQRHGETPRAVRPGQVRELCPSSAPHPRMGTVCSLATGCHGLEMGWPGRSVQHKAPPRMEVNFLHSHPFFCEPLSSDWTEGQPVVRWTGSGGRVCVRLGAGDVHLQLPAQGVLVAGGGEEVRPPSMEGRESGRCLQGGRAPGMPDPCGARMPRVSFPRHHLEDVYALLYLPKGYPRLKVLMCFLFHSSGSVRQTLIVLILQKRKWAQRSLG